MALFSAVLCVALMFMLTWTYAAATVVCQIVLGAYIYYRWSHFHDIISDNIYIETGSQMLTGAVLLTPSPSIQPSAVSRFFLIFVLILNKFPLSEMFSRIHQCNVFQEITDHPEHVKNFRPKILVSIFFFNSLDNESLQF